MADYAHSKGMVIGLKNAIGIIPNVISSVDFAVDENYFTNSERSSHVPFNKAGKALTSHSGLIVIIEWFLKLFGRLQKLDFS